VKHLIPIPPSMWDHPLHTLPVKAVHISKARTLRYRSLLLNEKGISIANITFGLPLGLML
jgi:hypothetical protein